MLEYIKGEQGYYGVRDDLTEDVFEFLKSNNYNFLNIQNDELYFWEIIMRALSHEVNNTTLPLVRALVKVSKPSVFSEVSFKLYSNYPGRLFIDNKIDHKRDFDQSFPIWMYYLIKELIVDPSNTDAIQLDKFFRCSLVFENTSVHDVNSEGSNMYFMLLMFKTAIIQKGIKLFKRLGISPFAKNKQGISFFDYLNSIPQKYSKEITLLKELFNVNERDKSFISTEENKEYSKVFSSKSLCPPVILSYLKKKDSNQFKLLSNLVELAQGGDEQSLTQMACVINQVKDIDLSIYWLKIFDKFNRTDLIVEVIFNHLVYFYPLSGIKALVSIRNDRDITDSSNYSVEKIRETLLLPKYFSNEQLTGIRDIDSELRYLKFSSTQVDLTNLVFAPPELIDVIENVNRLLEKEDYEQKSLHLASWIAILVRERHRYSKYALVVNKYIDYYEDMIKRTVISKKDVSSMAKIRKLQTESMN